MAGVLQHLRSSTLNKRPNPASMVDGQVAINYASGSPGMFFKDSNGSLVKVGPVHVGATAPNVSPASGGTAGNSLGEQWLDTSGGTYVFKIWDGAAWRSEAGEFVNASGDTMTGSLTMGVSADIIFEGSVDDGFETTLTVANPTADRTITLPNVTGTVVTTGDTGSVTSTMITDGTIVNADVNASAAIAGTKVSPNFGSQTVQTTGIFSAAGGSAAAPSIAFTGDTNTGIYSPGADQVALSTNGTGKLAIDSAGNVSFIACGLRARPGRIFDADASNGNITFLGGANDGANLELYGGTHATLANLAIIDADEVRFRNAAGGSERLRITSAGLVGIGTSSPKSRLHVVDDVTNNQNSFYSSNLYYDGSWKFIANGVGGALKLADAAGYISFITANTVNSSGADAAATVSTKMVIMPEGNVGIGTIDPVEKLEVRNGNIGLDSAGTSVGDRTTERFYKRTDNGSTNGMAAIGMNGAGANGFLGEIKFYTGTSDVFNASLSERARIDSSGRLLVGTSSARGSMGARLQLEAAGAGAAEQLSITYNGDNSVGAYLELGKTRGTTVGSNTAVINGDELGAINFMGANGTDLRANIGARISAVVDAEPFTSGDTTDLPSRLVFSTTADGASSPTERMRITQAGNINIATAGSGVNVSTGSTDGATFYGATGTIDGIIQASNNTAPVALFRRRTNDGSVIIFYRDTTGVGSISVTTTATAYNTSSDYRLKENVTAVTDGITRLQQLKPSRFNFIADPAKTVDGFLAHEVQTIVPEAITGEKDAVDDEGNPQYQSIDQSKLVPLLTAALQEAVAKIESLEARLTAAGL